MIGSKEAYPLRWPEGERRTRERQESRFKLTLAAARDDLLLELERLGARYVVISTNVSGRRAPIDPGVAVYFDLDGEQLVFACDKWTRVEDNVRAIGKTIEALRGIARWGSREMMKRSFSSFKTLPPDPTADWRATLGISPVAGLDEAKARYRKLAAAAHPDHGGSQHQMARLNAAWERAQQELG